MISVIVTIYKQLDCLNLVLQGLEMQSFKDFELIIAEDDNSPDSILFLKKAIKHYNYPIYHVSQKDQGFRKSKILNRALSIARGEKIVFLDGDCRPHKHFLKEHNRAINNNVFCCGRRAKLNMRLSNHLKQTGTISQLNLISLVLNSIEGTWKRTIYKFPSLSNKSIGIMGCNWSTTKKNLVEINGFDEDYENYGYEDCDINWRLLRINLIPISVKERAITYHLYHKEDGENGNYNRFSEKQKDGDFKCKNGLLKL
ncbi:MAG: glycosyltransferase [Bacteroidales bacterium]